MLEWMGLNFYCYDGLQSKMRAGIINEYECTQIIKGGTLCGKSLGLNRHESLGGPIQSF